MGEPMVCAQTGPDGLDTPGGTGLLDLRGDAAQPVVLACRACGHELGRTTARSLAVNGVVLVQAAVLVCSSCGKRRHWAPLSD